MARRGHPQSAATRAKISAALKGRRGKSHSGSDTPTAHSILAKYGVPTRRSGNFPMTGGVNFSQADAKWLGDKKNMASVRAEARRRGAAPLSDGKPSGSHKSSALPTTSQPKGRASEFIRKYGAGGSHSPTNQGGIDIGSTRGISTPKHTTLDTAEQRASKVNRSGSSHSKLSDAQKAAKAERARKRRAKK